MDEARERLLRLAVDGLMLAAEDAHKEVGLEMPPPSRMAVLRTRALVGMRPGFEAKSEAWLEEHRGLTDDAARELFRAQHLPLARRQAAPDAVAQEEITQLNG